MSQTEKALLDIPGYGEGPPAEIEIRYSWGDTHYRLNAKGLLEIGPVEDRSRGLDYAWDKVFTEPTQYEIKGKLVPDAQGSAFTLTELYTVKRVELKDNKIGSILNAQASVSAPRWAEVTTGENWVEFKWTPNEPSDV